MDRSTQDKINEVTAHNAVAALVGLYTEMIRTYDSRVQRLVEENTRLKIELEHLKKPPF